MRKHLAKQEIEELRRRQWALKIPDQQLADAAGICRSYITLMMNFRVPFQAKYKAAIENLFNRRETI